MSTATVTLSPGRPGGKGKPARPAGSICRCPPGATITLECGRWVLAYGPHGLRFSCPTRQDLDRVTRRSS